MDSVLSSLDGPDVSTTPDSADGNEPDPDDWSVLIACGGILMLLLAFSCVWVNCLSPAQKGWLRNMALACLQWLANEIRQEIPGCLALARARFRVILNNFTRRIFTRARRPRRRGSRPSFRRIQWRTFSFPRRQRSPCPPEEGIEMIPITSPSLYPALPLEDETPVPCLPNLPAPNSFDASVLPSAPPEQSLYSSVTPVFPSQSLQLVWPEPPNLSPSSSLNSVVQPRPMSTQNPSVPSIHSLLNHSAMSLSVPAASAVLGDQRSLSSSVHSIENESTSSHSSACVLTVKKKPNALRSSVSLPILFRSLSFSHYSESPSLSQNKPAQPQSSTPVNISANSSLDPLDPPPICLSPIEEHQSVAAVSPKPSESIASVHQSPVLHTPSSLVVSVHDSQVFSTPSSSDNSVHHSPVSAKPSLSVASVYASSPSLYCSLPHSTRNSGFPNVSSPFIAPVHRGLGLSRFNSIGLATQVAFTAAMEQLSKDSDEVEDQVEPLGGLATQEVNEIHHGMNAEDNLEPLDGMDIQGGIMIDPGMNEREENQIEFLNDLVIQENNEIQPGMNAEELVEPLDIQGGNELHSGEAEGVNVPLVEVVDPVDLPGGAAPDNGNGAPPKLTAKQKRELRKKAIEDAKMANLVRNPYSSRSKAKLLNQQHQK